MILHLLPRATWEALRAGDVREYAPASYADEGFIHASGTDEVMLAVANKHYRDADDELVVWELDESALTSEVRWEAPSPGPPPPGVPEGTRFPHIYGPIQLAAVTGARRLVRDEAGFCGYAPID
jgi:uncharacterized protein (DUF952 family)